MDIKDILKCVDHTLLNPCATFEDIKEIIDDAVKYGAATVCIPPSFVKAASLYSDGKIKICTVIGFPNGYATTAAKAYEAWDAVKNGADEIDMVINQGFIKDGRISDIIKEIDVVKTACNGRILKVIIETCFLTNHEIIDISRAVSQTEADFIKTSTGFGTGGATFEAVELMVKNCTKAVKAAGGISSVRDAEKFLELGATRLGTSRIIKIIKSGDENGEQTAY